MKTTILILVIMLSLGCVTASAEENSKMKLKVGDMAPDFTLKSPDGKQTVTLSSFRDKRPVALVFGSYT